MDKMTGAKLLLPEAPRYAIIKRTAGEKPGCAGNLQRKRRTLWKHILIRWLCA